MRIFISHSSRDAELARALIDLLQAALPITSEDIRCSSVDGYRLPGGVSTDEWLRNEVHDAELVIGLLTPNSLRSAYVSFELGARWGAQKRMIPLLAAGIAPDALEGPLGGINALDCGSDGQIHQLVEETASHLNVQPHRASTFAHQVNKLLELTSTPMAASNTSSVVAFRPQVSVSATPLLENSHTSRPDQLSILASYCERSRERWASVLSDERADSPSRFPNGYCEMGFDLVGSEPTTNFRELYVQLTGAKMPRFSSWSPFANKNSIDQPLSPYEDSLENWLGKQIDDSHLQEPLLHEFWRASLGGRLYTIRGYFSDGRWSQQREFGPGRVLALYEPIQRVADGISFAKRLAHVIDDQNVQEIGIVYRFTGLMGRSLVAMDINGFPQIGEYSPCIDEMYPLAKQVTLKDVDDDLPGVVHGLLTGLYELFGLYELSLEDVRGILE